MSEHCYKGWCSGQRVCSCECYGCEQERPPEERATSPEEPMRTPACVRTAGVDMTYMGYCLDRLRNLSPDERSYAEGYERALHWCAQELRRWERGMTPLDCKATASQWECAARAEIGLGWCGAGLATVETVNGKTVTPCCCRPKGHRGRHSCSTDASVWEDE